MSSRMTFALAGAAMICGGLFLLAAGPQQLPEQAAVDTKTVRISTEERIRKELAAPWKLRGTDMPLENVVRELRSKHGLPAVLDENALDNLGIAPDTLVDVERYHGLELRQALNLLAREFELGWLIRYESLVITTQEAADWLLVTKVYPVADLNVVRDQFGRPDEELDPFVDDEALLETVTYTIKPDSWDMNGGAGSMAALRGTLIVRQAPNVQDEIARLLEVLRVVRKRQFGRDASVRYRPLALVAVGASERRIRAVLKETTKFTFTEAPLADVASHLATKHRIPVLLDNKELNNAGIDDETPLSFHADDVTLENALHMALARLDLNFVVTDGALLITTEDAADAWVETRVYGVRDLVVDLDEENDDYDSLVHVLTTTVSPDSWEERGGMGTVEPFYGSFALVISQSEGAHQQIESLLAKLRAASTYKEPQLTPPAADIDKRLHVRVYQIETFAFGASVSLAPMDGETPEQAVQRVEAERKHVKGRLEEVIDLVKEAVAPDAWRREGVFIKALSDRIVVKHTAHVHKQVRRFLSDLDLYAPFGGFGPPGGDPFGGPLPVGGFGGGGFGGGFGGRAFGGGGFF